MAIRSKFMTTTAEQRESSFKQPSRKGSTPPSTMHTNWIKTSWPLDPPQKLWTQPRPGLCPSSNYRCQCRTFATLGWFCPKTWNLSSNRSQLEVSSFLSPREKLSTPMTSFLMKTRNQSCLLVVTMRVPSVLSHQARLTSPCSPLRRPKWILMTLVLNFSRMKSSARRLRCLALEVNFTRRTSSKAQSTKWVLNLSFIPCN